MKIETHVDDDEACGTVNITYRPDCDMVREIEIRRRKLARHGKKHLAPGAKYDIRLSFEDYGRTGKMAWYWNEAFAKKRSWGWQPRPWEAPRYDPVSGIYKLGEYVA